MPKNVGRKTFLQKSVDSAGRLCYSIKAVSRETRRLTLWKLEKLKVDNTQYVCYNL